MSSEDDDSKQFDPTEKKINDALEKGQTASSREVNTMSSFFGVAIAAALFAKPAISIIAERLSSIMNQSITLDLKTQTDLLSLFRLYGGQIFVVLIGPVALLSIFGLIGGLVQNKPRFVLSRIAPNFSHVSPMKGMKRIFGKKALIEFSKMALKMGLSMVCAGILITGFFQSLIDGPITETHVLLDLLNSQVLQVLLVLTVSMIFFAGIDYFLSHREWFKNLKMSHKELKDEQKQAEGDPMMKARTLSIGRDRARRRMMKAVPTATFVVTNPTHFAVALRYDAARDAAPVVVAKGQDLVALKIREIAEANDVHIHEEPPLARALYKSVAIDQQIPEEYFEAIAAIILFLRQRRGRH